MNARILRDPIIVAAPFKTPSDEVERADRGVYGTAPRDRRDAAPDVPFEERQAIARDINLKFPR